MKELWITLEGHKPYLLARQRPNKTWHIMDTLGEGLLTLFENLGWPDPSTANAMPQLIIREKESQVLETASAPGTP